MKYSYSDRNAFCRQIIFSDVSKRFICTPTFHFLRSTFARPAPTPIAAPGCLSVAAAPLGQTGVARVGLQLILEKKEDDQQEISV